ncbi:MAG TPA: hypothetical protein VFF95_07610 [Candidatus Binatus sp.]|nr:hypothetical protein [Candidatus Binatus sp.]
MRSAHTTRFNLQDVSHCGIRRELTSPFLYVPTTRYYRRPAKKEYPF